MKDYWLTAVGYARTVGWYVGWAVAVSLVPTLAVSANDHAPRPDMTRSGAPLYYSIANTRFTQSLQSKVSVYYTEKPSAAWRVHIGRTADNGTWCGGTMRVSINIGGEWRATQVPSCSAYGSWNVDPDLAVYDADTGRYKMDIIVKHDNGNGQFRFVVRADQGTVRSLASGVMGYETILPRGRPSYGAYHLNFGSDCRVQSAGTMRRPVILTDPDNHPEDRSGAQRNRAFYVHVEEAHRSSAQFQAIHPGRYDGFRNIDRHGDRLRPFVRSGAASESYFWFDMKADHKYRFVIDGLDHNNTIQVELPTDEIYYDVPCQWWRQAGESGAAVNTPNPKLWASYAPRRQASQAGQQLFFAHRVINGDNDPHISVARPTTLEVWAQRFWTTNPTLAAPGTSAQPSQWNPPPHRLPNAALPNAQWGNMFYYVPNWFPGVTQPVNPYILQPADLGRSERFLCERIGMRPIGHDTSGTTGGWYFSVPACVELQRAYDATPRVTLDSTSIHDGARSVDGIKGFIHNSGPAPTDTAVSYVSRFVLKKQATVVLPTTSTVHSVPYNPAAPGNLVPQWACHTAERAWGGTDCRALMVHGSGRSFAAGQTEIFTGQDDPLPSGLAVGDRVCYVAALTRYSRRAGEAEKPSNEFRVSPPVCAVVSKRPKVQFWGGDVRAGTPSQESDIVTSRTMTQGVMYGSWGEYGMMASGTITSSSGAGLSSDASGRPFGPPPGYNRLTFANTTTPFGRFASVATTRPDAFFQGGTLLGSSTVRPDDIRGAVVYRRSGHVQLQGGTLRPGASLIVRATDTVTVTGSLQYADGPYTLPQEIPQLVIIAPRIVIMPEVTRLDGWLSADDYVSTCGTVSTPNNWLAQLAGCDRPLTINGPVTANRLYLRRTHGAERQHPGQPAEIINLRPDAYLWGYARSRQSGAIKTSYIRELPPRL